MFRRIICVALSGLLVGALSGCGGGGETESKSSREAPAASEPAASDTPAGMQVVVIRPVGEEMKYATTEFTVKAGEKVKVVMENTATSPAMQHNVVITKPGTNTDEVGMAAVAAGEAHGYIPQDNDAILFYTEIAKPGTKTEVEFVAPSAGDYPYVCTFPGHFALMKGVMHSVQ